MVARIADDVTNAIHRLFPLAIGDLASNMDLSRADYSKSAKLRHVSNILKQEYDEGRWTPTDCNGNKYSSSEVEEKIHALNWVYNVLL